MSPWPGRGRSRPEPGHSGSRNRLCAEPLAVTDGPADRCNRRKKESSDSSDRHGRRAPHLEFDRGIRLGAEGTNSRRPPRGTFVHLEALRAATTDPAAGWELEFSEGEYRVRRDRITVFEGKYRIAADTLFLDSERSLPWDACGEQEGNYEWRMDEEGLVLLALDESCERRRNRLSSGPLIEGSIDPPEVVPVPATLRRLSFLGQKEVVGDSLVPALATLLIEEAEMFGLTGKAAILEFAADFFCATGARKPGSINYERFGPCSDEVRETVEWRPFRFATTEDGILEKGSYVLRLFERGEARGTGVGRYEVTWVRGAEGSWKIERFFFAD